MSIVSCDTSRGAVDTASIAAVDAPQCVRLHRIKEVREQQGLSLRAVAHRLGISMTEAQDQEEGLADLPLRSLYRWQEALEVPISVLLVDDALKLSAPVYERARMLRLMKTVVTLQEAANSKRTERLVQTMMDQLTEIMPDLQEVGPWHSSGSQRGLDDLGRVVERRMSDEALAQAWTS